MRTIRNGQHVRTTAVRVGTLNLRAYPQPPGMIVPVAGEVLRTPAFGQTVDARTENRARFGRSLSMDRIESALLAAYRGNMRDITDILVETVDTDPHLGSVLNKRIGALSALPFEVQPATGVSINRDKAIFYADVVRQQLRNMKSFRRNLGQLGWALFNGRSCLELNWVLLDPGAGPISQQFGQPSMAVAEMDWIHPRRLSFGPNRELRITSEQNPAGGNFAAVGISVHDYPDKFIYWLPQLFNEYPEREGLGMRCMYWSFFKRFAARERMVLTELYGKPWRIVTVDPESNAGEPELSAADKIVDALGASHTARLPRGLDLKVVSPVKSAGEVHADIITDADKQNSKLVLGQTGTTDGVPSGLNNNQANVMQDEQLGVLFRDAALMSEVVESFLCDRIIAVNFGETEVTHAPTFKLRADLPADRKAELERLKAALDAGLTISVGEAYEVSGFSQPEALDVVIRIEQPPTPPNSPVAPAVRPVVVYPIGATPQVGEQQPITPEAGKTAGESKSGAQVGVVDSASTIKVNEDRASRGLPPLTLPDGSPDPRGELTVKEFNELIAAQNAPAPAAPMDEGGLPPEGGGDLPIAARRRPASALRQRWAGYPRGAQVARPAAPQRALLADHVGDEIVEGEQVYGDGGIHGHVLLRELLATGLDGQHAHVFLLPNGLYVVSQLDGAHTHALATEDEEATVQDGGHVHAVMVNGVGHVAVAVGSEHRHALQVDATAVDGGHTHLLELPDPDNAGGTVQVRSLTPGQIARAIADGSLSEDFDDELDEGPQRVFTEVTHRVTPGRMQRRFELVLGRAEDAVASFELAQGAEVADLEREAWDTWVASHGVSLAVKQEATSNGTPEDLIARGMRELVAEAGTWASLFEAAAEGETSVLGLHRALSRTRQKLKVGKFGRALERRKLQAMMLGALDDAKEISKMHGPPGTQAPVVTAAMLSSTLEEVPELKGLGTNWALLAKSGEFSKKPFKQALAHFQSMQVLDRATFEKASASIKQRSFTVAGVLGDQMLQVLQADLVKAIEEGEDLHNFKARIRPRLEQAGFLGTLKSGQQALGPSHVETVFRTNVLNTYNTGRYVHQSSPAVLAVFPVWQIQGVKDDRTRDAHESAHGKKLLANDPFWNKAYPPFGFNCRCRVVALPKSQMKGVVSGSTIVGLPDSGFTSGKPTLAVG